MISSFQSILSDSAISFHPVSSGFQETPEPLQSERFFDKRYNRTKLRFFQTIGAGKDSQGHQICLTRPGDLVGKKLFGWRA